jgi:hypothetical protein
MVAAVFYFSVRIDPQTAAAALAKIERSSVGVLFPETHRERVWIGWLSISAGIWKRRCAGAFSFITSQPTSRSPIRC